MKELLFSLERSTFFGVESCIIIGTVSCTFNVFTLWTDSNCNLYFKTSSFYLLQIKLGNEIPSANICLLINKFFFQNYLVFVDTVKNIFEKIQEFH